MATARRAYTSEYSFNFTPEVRPERVRRTRQRPERPVEKQVRRAPESGTLSQDTLRALIAGVLAIGVILIAMVIVNAHTASLQYDVNQLESHNAILRNFFLSSAPLALVLICLNLHQLTNYFAPFLKKITPTVLRIIFKSRPMLQLSMYSKSSFTTSSKSSILLLPLTCHIPVIPGFILSRLL